jgi:AcrR family transcriptional regulator
MGRKFLAKERLEDEQRKREWAKALTPLFLERGLKQFPMDAVAAELGMSKATLYKYFRSREEILDLALELKLRDIRRYQESLNNRELPYLVRLVKALQISSAELSSISTLFLEDLKNTYPRVWKQVQLFIDEALAVLRAFYEEGIERGELAPLHPAVLVITDELFFGCMAEPDFLRQRGLSIQEALDSYFILKFGGMFSARWRAHHDLDHTLRALGLQQRTNGVE